MSSNKRLCQGKEDIILKLPRELVDYILEQLPGPEAAKTSLLSRSWRFIWSSRPKLIFDEEFLQHVKLIRGKSFVVTQYAKFTKLINTLLLLHDGPVLEFCLHIPRFYKGLRKYSEINDWLLSLSRNKIEELQITNSNQGLYRLPSYIWWFTSLKKLKLENCKLRPPHDALFEGFRNLVTAEFVGVSFCPNTSETLLDNTPLIERLTFRCCTGLEHKIVRATPKLVSFTTVESYKVGWQWFERNQQLRNVHLELGRQVNADIYDNDVDLIKLVRYLPRVVILRLDGWSLQFLAADRNVPESLPTKFSFVTSLTLHNFALHDLHQVSSALCLIRSSPNLINLDINVLVVKKKDIKQVTSITCLKEAISNTTLENLQKVRIGVVKGRKVEMLLIKFLLACSTSLQKMDIEQSYKVRPNEMKRISREVFKFSKASTAAINIHTQPHPYCPRVVLA